MDNELVVILGDVLLIVIDSNFVAVRLLLSVTLRVAEFGPPAVVGVPEITPLELSDRPGGNVPEAMVQVYGAVPPVADSVCEYAKPTLPFCKVFVVIARGEGVFDVVNCRSPP